MRLNRFAPWMLLGCLIVVTGCGKEKAVPSSGPVGHVVVVKGEVRAQRATQGGAEQEGAEQKARLVQVDDIVFADDTIVTSSEASVQILITHNGALWELGERSSRRIDKGIAFRATKKGEAPLDRKERIATAAAGRNTTREAGDSVGTIMADETRPLPQAAGASAADQGAAEPPGATGAAASPSPSPNRSPASRTPAKPKPTASPPPPPSGPPASTRRRGSAQETMNESAPSKTVGGSLNVKANDSARAKKRKGSAKDSRTPTEDQDQREFDGEADDNEPADRPSPSPVVAKEQKKVAPGAEQRAYLLALVRTCQKTHSGTGTLRYKRIANGQLTVSSTAKSLAPLVTCVKRAIRSKAPPNKAAVSGSLQL